jgi:3-methylcrotonyl-CoA carboxylase alpha subunit
MEKAGVPVTPGYHGEDQDPAIWKPAPRDRLSGADQGGRRRRRQGHAQGRGREDFLEALDSCKREAASSFGDDRVLIEKFISNPAPYRGAGLRRRRGRVVHFFERDCSLQRRHQKVIEEAPAPGMTPNVRAAMCSAAVQAAKAVDYVGAGTVEFIVDGSGRCARTAFISWR